MTIALALVSMTLRAQFGNEWISYDQPYWKIPVASNGLYKISYSQLEIAGFPVSTVNPQFIAVFAKGQQQYISISGEGDGIFDSQDYVEFYGQRNDGWLDTLVYTSPLFQANPGYSLFNDTLHYFITIQNEPGLRRSISPYTDWQNYSTSSFCTTHAQLALSEEYLIGKQDYNGISLPSYDQGEGWFGHKYAQGEMDERIVATPGALVNGVPDARVKVRNAGASLALGSPNHHLQVGWGSPINIAIDTLFYGYQLNQLSFTIPSSQMSNSTRIIHRSLDDINVASDYQAVSWIDIEYARSFDFASLSEIRFKLDNPNNESVLHLAVSNWTGTPRLFVMKNGASIEIPLFELAGQIHAAVPMDGAPELCWINDAQAMDVTPSKVTSSGYFTDFGALELVDAMVMITHASLANAVNNYAAYRNLSGMEVLKVDVEELYWQYGGGIEKNPLSIRRFCDHLLQQWSSAPKYLFLIGKSIHEANYSATLGARNDPEKYARNLVPTWGYPGSDILFTSGLSNTLFEPAISTGRLSAQQPDEVLEYLNKVIEHESQEPAMWQKNILHFGGGSIQFEQNTFRTYLNGYKSIAQDTLFGGKVYSFFKNSTDPIQLAVSDSIQLLINEGVSLMTFFGHASATGFDQNIDSPETYNNQGKYPLLIGNSCYTGNIHLSDANSASERFVISPSRGVIGFLAKSDLGIPSYLNFYTDQFYRSIFQNHYGASIGECMQHAIRGFQVPNDFYRQNVAETFSLHGDPSVRLHVRPLPDYQISASSIFTEPENITAAIPTFQVKVVIENPGKALDQLVNVELVRHYPNGVDSVYSKTLSHVYYRDTVEFELPVDPAQSVGMNGFDVFVDYPLNLIDELDDAGNNVVLQKQVLIASGDLIPVYPQAFSVINQSQPVLHASVGFAFEPVKTYVLQVDTTDTYNSPLFAQTSIAQSGGVIDWSLPFVLEDSMVVFWRCSADSIDPQNGFRWRESTFQYIANETGWGQDHFFQFKDNYTTNLDYERSARRWNFDPLNANLKCEVYGTASSSFESQSTLYQIGLAVQEYGGFGFSPSALMVAVIDSSSFIPWESNYNGANPNYDFGNTLASANARGRAERYFIFQQNDPSQLAGFADMVENEIPDGNYLLIYSWQFAQKNLWPDEVTSAFENLGADELLAAPDSLPFIFFKKMGHDDTILEVVGSTSEDHIVLNAPLQGALGQGLIQSPVFGPTAQWQRAEWDWLHDEQEAGDTLSVRLYGIGWNGQTALVADWQEFPNTNSEVANLLEGYPFATYEARIKDEVFTTPPQLDRWHLMSAEVPECAIDAHSGFSVNNDTLQEGDKLQLALAIRNISEVDMDSLLVRYYIIDSQNQKRKVEYPRQGELLAGGILLDTLHLLTIGLSGRNTLHIEVNPLDSITGAPDQLEKYHFNNLAQFDFVVETDRINPVLDVTFDGVHILNGDIVSTQPEIRMVLDDENPYFILNEAADTSHFKVFLTTPDASDIPVYFATGAMEWFPAAGNQNKSYIEYHPAFLKDGVYALRVQASDKSGNTSGDFDYQVQFEVITSASITEVLNYPNPFSTRTQFIFTITGTEVPDEMKIQIMNVNGDIVREITQAEMGPLRIGRNRTEYWWDGRDEYGDPLANGVYLYRVIARLNGENMDLRATDAGRYFTKGFGKMYLMR